LSTPSISKKQDEGEGVPVKEWRDRTNTFGGPVLGTQVVGERFFTSLQDWRGGALQGRG
jgi:hypothetical protein